MPNTSAKTVPTDVYKRQIKFFLLFCSLAGYSTIISAQDKTVNEKKEKDSTIISIPYGSKLKTEFSASPFGFA